MGETADEARRDAARRMLESALADGQLSPDEFEARSQQLDAATGPADVDRTVHDLRPARGETRPGAGRSSTLRRAGVAAVAVLLVGGLGHALTRADEDSPRDDRSQQHQPRSLSTGLAEFRSSYEAEFDTTHVGAVQLDPGYARVEQPVESDPPRFQAWSFDGDQFSRQGRVAGGAPGTIDLAEVDVEAVEATVEQGIAGLGLEDPSRVTVVLAPSTAAAPARIWISIRNEFGEVASLSTDLEGHEVSRRAFGEED